MAAAAAKKARMAENSSDTDDEKDCWPTDQPDNQEPNHKTLEKSSHDEVMAEEKNENEEHTIDTPEISKEEITATSIYDQVRAALKDHETQNKEIVLSNEICFW